MKEWNTGIQKVCWEWFWSGMMECNSDMFECCIENCVLWSKVGRHVFD